MALSTGSWVFQMKTFLVSLKLGLDPATIKYV